MTRSTAGLARQLDFEDLTDVTFPAPRPLRASLHLAARPEGVRGPNKYKELEHRRRQAQIKARRLLDLC
jgi:hypothetical protein